MPNTSEQLGKTLSESVPYSKCELYSERTIDLYKNGVTKEECETNEKATKRLNIPFDEMVYQDLISLNGIRMKIKSDEFSRLVDTSRRIRKNDPEPDLLNFVRPSKQEFLFCDLMGKNFENEGDDLENCQSYCATIECDDSAFVLSTESESGKPPVFVEMDSGNLDLGAYGIEKCRLLHENYCLDPPQVKSHFEGSSLYKRSHAWKLS